MYPGLVQNLRKGGGAAGRQANSGLNDEGGTINADYLPQLNLADQVTEKVSHLSERIFTRSLLFLLFFRLPPHLLHQGRHVDTELDTYNIILDNPCV